MKSEGRAGGKGTPGSRMRSTARRASTERVRTWRSEPLTGLERFTLPSMGVGVDAEGGFPCTLDDRGRLAPFPASAGKGGGLGWAVNPRAQRART